MMDNGSKAFKSLLSTVAVLCACPNHAEAALQSLYAGILLASSDSVFVYLEKVREIAEDAYGPVNRWTINQASLVITKIVACLKDKNLVLLTSSFVVHLLFYFPAFRDTVTQYKQRIPQTQSSTVYAITNLCCFQCDGQHLLKECKVVKCLKCTGVHIGIHSEIIIQEGMLSGESLLPRMNVFLKRPESTCASPLEHHLWVELLP